MDSISSNLLMQIFISAPIILIVAISILVIASLGIQARRRAEYKNHELNAILSSMGEGLIVVDIHRRVIIINQAAGVLLRQAPQELIGKKIGSVLQFSADSKHASASAVSIIEQVIFEQDVMRFNDRKELCCKKPDSTCSPVNLTASPFFYKKQLHGVVLLLQGIGKKGRV